MFLYIALQLSVEFTTTENKQLADFFFLYTKGANQVNLLFPCPDHTAQHLCLQAMRARLEKASLRRRQMLENLLLG